MKPGDKVTPKEDHHYLGITKRNVGTVLEIQGYGILAKFKCRRKGPILFSVGELKVKK